MLPIEIVIFFIFLILVLRYKIVYGIYNSRLKIEYPTLAGWLSWLECHPVYQKVCRFDPWSGHIWEATNWCFSLPSLSPPPPPSPSLPSSVFSEQILRWGLKKQLLLNGDRELGGFHTVDTLEPPRHRTCTSVIPSNDQSPPGCRRDGYL